MTRIKLLSAKRVYFTKTSEKTVTLQGFDDNACLCMSVDVIGARLYTREMNLLISNNVKNSWKTTGIIDRNASFDRSENGDCILMC